MYSNAFKCENQKVEIYPYFLQFIRDKFIIGIGFSVYLGEFDLELNLYNGNNKERVKIIKGEKMTVTID